MREYTHYGEKVTYILNKNPYEKVLENNGKEYTLLPIISQDYRVLQYDDKIAICRTRSEDEEVFVFEKFPIDLNLDELMIDVRRQRDGDDPMRTPTMAKALLTHAEKAAGEHLTFEEVLYGYDESKYIEYVKYELAFYGGIEYLKTLPHDDIDPDFWNKIVSE